MLSSSTSLCFSSFIQLSSQDKSEFSPPVPYLPFVFQTTARGNIRWAFSTWQEFVHVTCLMITASAAVTTISAQVTAAALSCPLCSSPCTGPPSLSYIAGGSHAG